MLISPAAFFNCCADSATQARSSVCTDSLDLGLGHDQRRQEAHHIVAGADGEQLLVAQRVDEIARRHHGLDADQQSLAAHFREHGRDSGRPPRRSFCLSSSDIFCTCSKKPGFSMTSSTALAAAIASGLPPKVEPCEPGVMPDAASAVARHGADREAAAERLGQRHDVGRHAEALVGEEIAGAAHAGLHLVEDQQQAVLVAELRAAP